MDNYGSAFSYFAKIICYPHVLIPDVFEQVRPTNQSAFTIRARN